MRKIAENIAIDVGGWLINGEAKIFMILQRRIEDD